MTENEQHCLIGEMVAERNALRRKATCLEEKIRRAGEGMRQALETINVSTQGHWRLLERGFAFLSAEELNKTMVDLHSTNERIAQIEKSLDSC